MLFNVIVFPARKEAPVFDPLRGRRRKHVRPRAAGNHSERPTKRGTLDIPATQ
jgi:hypothetical protein